MKVERYFIGTDPHVLMLKGKIAGVDLKTNNAVVSYIEDAGPWDGYVSLGDVYDLNVISDHNKGRLKLVEGQRVFDDIQAGNAYLTQQYIAAGRPKKVHLVAGNHEFRMKRYIDANPELDGIVNLEKHIPSFVNYVDYWGKHELLEIGKLLLIHGIGSAKGQCAAALRDYGKSVVMGHSHRIESASLRYHGDDETKIAQSIGCLCEYGQPYLNGRPTMWSQGFATLSVWPDGRFNLTPVLIFDHAFVAPNGKFYDGKRIRPATKLAL